MFRVGSRGLAWTFEGLDEAARLLERLEAEKKVNDGLERLLKTDGTKDFIPLADELRELVQLADDFGMDTPELTRAKEARSAPQQGDTPTLPGNFLRH